MWGGAGGKGHCALWWTLPCKGCVVGCDELRWEVMALQMMRCGCGVAGRALAALVVDDCG